jgi:hypothetical protein
MGDISVQERMETENHIVGRGPTQDGKGLMLEQKVSVTGFYINGELKIGNEYSLPLCAKYGWRYTSAVSVFSVVQ